MNVRKLAVTILTIFALIPGAPVEAQIGRRFPAEKKIVLDPVTGVPLTFLTSTPAGDSKIYQTHPQWTSDGQWLIFKSQRAAGQALAVNEASGDIVQVMEHGFIGMLCVAPKSMRLFHLRPVKNDPALKVVSTNAIAWDASPPFEVVATDLAKVFADSQTGSMKAAREYEHVFGTIPAGMAISHELALDANEEAVYFRLKSDTAGKHLPANTKLEPTFGPRNMGAGPAGIGSMDLKTGEVKIVVTVPFQVGHIQSNPFVPGEIIFCWETAGKSPQRTWVVNADGSGLRPLYPEARYDWVTHETVISKDEVAIALLGHRAPGTNDAWRPSGTREHATGLGIVNLRTREFSIVGQTKSGSGLWHVHGAPDGRWAVGDDFARNIYLIDRRTNEMTLLSTGHKDTAADHPHPSFSADSTRMQIQSAMLSADNRSMNLCIISVPDAWLKRTYSESK